MHAGYLWLATAEICVVFVPALRNSRGTGVRRPGLVLTPALAGFGALGTLLPSLSFISGKLEIIILVLSLPVLQGVLKGQIEDVKMVYKPRTAA